MSKSAVIIGAGITGVSTALWMQRDGWDVTVIDRTDPGSPDQTSFGNGGILARCAVIPVSVPGLLRKAPAMLADKSQPLFLRWSYLPKLLPWVIPFLRHGRMDRMRKISDALGTITYDSVDQHLALAKGTPAESFLKIGDYSYVYTTPEARAGDAMGHGIRRDMGFEQTENDRDWLAKGDPHLSPEFTAATTFADHGWISDPGGYLAALCDILTGAGGRILQAEVEDVAPKGAGAMIRVKNHETIEADKAVICAGVWSRKLAERFGLRVPMEAERGYHVMLHGTNIQPPHPYMIAAGKFVLTPMRDGIRLAGVVEFGGIDAPPSEAPLNLLRSYIKRVYPDLTWERETTWMGRRPSTTDSLPFVGPVPEAPGVLMAFGSQHIGLTIGPKLGRMIADMASDRTTNTDVAAFRVDRFG